MAPTVVTLFSGGGLKTVGAMAAGFVPVLAVEWNPDPKVGPEDAIAQVYADNLGQHVVCKPVQDVDYRPYAGADLLMASPVCKEFSLANAGGKEGQAEVASAQGVCRAVREIGPRLVVIENVWGYRNSHSLRLICAQLTALGYRYDVKHVNSADYGVPQTRKRLILRAVRGGSVPPLRPTHTERQSASGGLFEEETGLEPWRGWYGAIEDLIPSLPGSQFANWQIERLPEMLRTSLIEGDAAGERPPTCRTSGEPAFTLKTASGGRPHRAFLVDGTDGHVTDGGSPAATVTASYHQKTAVPRALLVSNAATEYSDGTREGSQPSLSVTTQHAGRLRALLVDGCNSRPDTGQPTCRTSAEPSFTLPASPKGVYRAWTDGGRVVRMTPRALARFQTVPDWYRLPEKPSLAATVIGNAVPCTLAEAVCNSLRGCL